MRAWVVLISLLFVGSFTFAQVRPGPTSYLTYGRAPLLQQQYQPPDGYVLPEVALYHPPSPPRRNVSTSDSYAFLVTMMLVLTWFTGIVRWLFGAIVQIQRPQFGIKKDYTNQPSVSILLPCYNEGEHVYETIVSLLKSNYPALDVIATDDCSRDDSWQWIQKAAAEFPNVRALRNPINMGKTRTILNACDYSQSEFVIIVDSDTIFGPDAIREMIACFADKTLGAVGAPAHVKNNNDNALTTFQTYLYYLGFRLAKVPECFWRTVGCLGGYALTMKRSILLEIKPDLEARHWFGIKIRDGEDRFITHQVLLHGYNTYMDMQADVWTIVPSDFKAYFLQQLRWRRSYTRDFTFTLRTLWRHVGKVHPSIMYTYVLSPIVTLIGLVQLATYGLSNPLNWVDPRKVIVFVGLSFFVVLMARRLHPHQGLNNPLKLLMFVTWWLVNNLFLTPLAFLTLDSGGWGNRDKTVLKGEKA